MVTIVSTLPVQLDEFKPGLIPDRFVIEPAKKDDFSIKVIGDCRQFFLGSDPNAPPMVSVVGAVGVARSIISDFSESAMGTSTTPNLEGIQPIPGLFFIEGSLTKPQIVKEHAESLNTAFKNTRAWFENLVFQADDEWAKTRQRGMITDMQRVACRWLGYDKEWNFNTLIAQSSTCWSCRTNIHPDALVCSGCKAILKPEEYKKVQGQFVGA